MDVSKSTFKNRKICHETDFSVLIKNGTAQVQLQKWKYSQL